MAHTKADAIACRATKASVHDSRSQKQPRCLLRAALHAQTSQVSAPHMPDGNFLAKASMQVVVWGVQVLMDVLMGKRVQLDVAESAFWRRLGGEQSPQDLELSLQMVHALFTHYVRPVPEELATCLKYAHGLRHPRPESD